MKNILVTGGLGFIGSHTCVELINEGYVPVIIDNLSNSKVIVSERIEKITGIRPKVYVGDIRDEALLCDIIENDNIEAVIHFAGLKAVGESVKEPMMYYENNVGGTISLLRAMREKNVKNIVFSSSATVYGTPERIPIDEECKGTPTNPYGATKALIERILTDIAESDSSWNMMILRYFNPIGAHESGLIGEDPNGIPNNLVPYIARVANGHRRRYRCKGLYPCRGSCKRSYLCAQIDGKSEGRKYRESRDRVRILGSRHHQGILKSMRKRTSVCDRSQKARGHRSMLLGSDQGKETPGMVSRIRHRKNV